MTLATSHWYAVEASALVEAETVHQAFLFGQELAVWRSTSGTIHAWDNRCPHRSVRLSLGFVEGERLVCRYHGWRYGTNGQCIHIPAHPGMSPPRAAVVTRRACLERDGVIWVSLGMPSEASVPSLGPGAGYGRSYTVAVEAQQLLALAQRDGWTLAFPQVLHTSQLDGRGAYLAVQPLRAGHTTVHLIQERHAAEDSSWVAMNAAMKSLVAGWRDVSQSSEAAEARHA